VQMCGRGLSVFGAGKVAAVGDVAGFAVWTDATIETLISQCGLQTTL
jgi:hypothetical protein